MSSVRPSYYLSPSWDLSPDEVALGSVIANIKLPHRPLSSPDLAKQIDSKVHEQGPKPASGIVKKSSEWSVGIFSSFVQMASVGGEISYSSRSSQDIEYSCESMETKRFTPSLAYVSKVAQDETVRPHLKFGGLGTQVFVVTGLKIASGVTLTTTVERGNEVRAQLGVEVPVPELKIGPQGSRKSEASSTHSTTIDGPIVFAFQVEKLCVGLRGDVKSKEFVKGAMLGKKGTDDYVFEKAGGSLTEDEIEDLGMSARAGFDEETGEEYEIVWRSD